jgi:hypothetical protein
MGKAVRSLLVGDLFVWGKGSYICSQIVVEVSLDSRNVTFLRSTVKDGEVRTRVMETSTNATRITVKTMTSNGWRFVENEDAVV